MPEFRKWSNLVLRRVAIRVILAVGVVVVVLVRSASTQAQGVAQELADSDRIVALVVGNGRLEEPLSLTQPAADAAAVAARLRLRGFQLVTLAAGGGCGEGEPQIDLDRAALRAAIACFAKASEGASQAVFYFSGHTIVVEGRNYLVPATATIMSPSSASDLVDLDVVLEALDQARIGLSVVVLDAARPAIARLATTPGLKRVTTTGRPRIVAYSAGVGSWTGESGRRRGRSNRTAEPDTNQSGPDDALSSLSPYTRRLIRLLDEDLDLRSLGLPGVEVGTLFLSASGGDAELMSENVATAQGLGKRPRIGSAACDMINWRAQNFEYCLEIAAAYESCGKDAVMRQKLQKSCPADWSTIVRYSLLASMAGVMKAKTCTAFKEFIAKFELEPSTAELKEFKELRSLAQYTCANEAKEQLKSRFSGVMSTRDCLQIHHYLVESRGIIEPEMRAKIEKRSKETCCPEFAMGGACVTRQALVKRVIAKLEQKGCAIGKTTEAKSSRAMKLVARINADARERIDLSVNGAPLDQIWAHIDAFKKDDCLCRTLDEAACKHETAAAGTRDGMKKTETVPASEVSKSSSRR